MPITRPTAVELMDIVNTSAKRFIQLLPTLERELTEEELKRIKREIGRVLGTMDDGISAKVAAEFPELAPQALPIAHKL